MLLDKLEVYRTKADTKEALASLFGQWVSEGVDIDSAEFYRLKEIDAKKRAYV